MAGRQTLSALSLAAVLAGACAETARSVQTAAAVPQKVAPASAEPPRPAPATPEPPVPEPPAPTPVKPLPWVSPARCLPVCAMDPSPRLVPVDKLGQPDARGRLQVLAEVQAPIRALLVAARAAGHPIRIESAFRSYEEQVRLFQQMKEIGRAARPGHSEHQLGSALDLRLPTGAALAWLAAHAAEFGFAQSYPAGKQRQTGYRPEPWHVRFVDGELARELQQRGLAIEELFRERPGLGESGSCADCPHPSSRAPCGAVTAAGTCAGDVLSWCYEGALASVDCATSGQRCGAGIGEGQRDCVAPPAPTPDQAPR